MHAHLCVARAALASSVYSIYVRAGARPDEPKRVGCVCVWFCQAAATRQRRPQGAYEYARTLIHDVALWFCRFTPVWATRHATLALCESSAIHTATCSRPRPQVQPHALRALSDLLLLGVPAPAVRVQVRPHLPLRRRALVAHVLVAWQR
jgi:hypothetical protein